MDDFNFGFISANGSTIYRICFDRYAIARWTLMKPEKEWSKSVPKIEETFFWLVEQGQKRLGIEAVNEIIQRPNSNGETCFLIATQCSPKIAKFILSQDIKINSITTDMMIPSFQYPELAEQMMIRNINPNVIGCSGISKVGAWPNSFKNPKCKERAQRFPRSIHFVTEDTVCNKNCGNNCKTKLKAFFCENGPLVDINDNNKLGTGGFGTVYGGKWHGEDVAMKCILIGQIQFQNLISKAVSDFEKNISEYRSQWVAKGSGVIIPHAMVRQQNQEFKDEKWVSLNINVFIYPKYDCNLYELHQNHFHNFTDDILENILDNCLVRNDLFNRLPRHIFQISSLFPNRYKSRNFESLSNSS